MTRAPGVRSFAAWRHQQAPKHRTRAERLLAEIPAVERRLTAAGISTAVLEGGDGPPLVLLHGPAANAAHWMRVIPDLARDASRDRPRPAGPRRLGRRRDGERMVAWLGELIEATCPAPPALVGLAAGGAIAARFAADHGDRISRLVLVDALGLTDFAPAPQFGAALHAFLADPSERTHDDLWHHCALDFDRLRERMGERWEPFRAYNLDRAARPGAMAALGGLMDRFGMHAIPAARPRAHRGADGADLGPRRPRHQPLASPRPRASATAGRCT